MAEEYWYQPISMETIRGATCEELRAELADRKDAHFSIVRELTNRAKAAEAENARLRALPLKDEVERVLERAKTAFESDTLHDKTAALLDVDAILSRLRAGEQEGWRSMDNAPKDGTKVVLAEWDTWNECWRFGVSWWRKYLNEGEGFGWIGHKPTHWMPLPSSPSISEGGGRNG